MAKKRRNRKSSADEKGTDSKNPSQDASHSTTGKQGSVGNTDSKSRSASPDKHINFEQLRQMFPVMPSLSRVLTVLILIFGIIAVGALFYKVMAGFFVPLFLAALLVVIFRPVHQWILERSGGRRRLAALSTTGAVLLVVLLPIILVISVAASQFTAMVSHVDFDDLSEALDGAREQFGISLPKAEQFRRLDELADSLDAPQAPDETVTHQQLLSNIEETLELVRFLQAEVPGPAASDAAAGQAEARLKELAEAVRKHSEGSAGEPFSELDAEEQFHRQSVITSAAIRSWMRTLLGGTFRSQVRLIANPSAEDFKNLLRRGRESLQPRFVTLTSATGSFLLQALIGLVVLVIALYFFLIDGPAMIHTLMRLSPLDERYEERLLLEFDRTSRAVALASVLSALVQGLLAAVAFYFLGFDSVIFLFLLTSLMALVPFLGAASVWVPCAVYLGMIEQRWSAAIFLAIYGAAVVSSIDNVIKMFVLHGRSTLHPLLALLSVLGGVKVFGPIGILVGPMVVVFLQTLLEILNHELARHEKDQQPVEEASAES